MRSQYVHILAAAFGMASWLGKIYWFLLKYWSKKGLEFFCHFGHEKALFSGKIAKLIRFQDG